MRYVRRGRKRIILYFLVVFMIIGILLVWLVDWCVRPMIKTYGNTQAVTAATRAVNDAALSVMTGRGPNLSISVPMDSTVETAYSNKFESAGINQTKHEIALDVKVTVYTVVQGESQANVVNTAFTITECILVGEVPQWLVRSIT